MAHNQFVLQQLNFHHFIRVRFRLRRYFRRCRMWRRKWLHPARRRAFGIYDQLLLELRHEDPSTFQEISLHGSCLRWNPCKGQRRIWKQYTWFREPLEEGLELAVTLRRLVAGSIYPEMQYGWRVPENALSFVVREVCQAICDECADEVMTFPSNQDGRWQLDGFYRRWNSPHCVAAINGTHVAIRKPPLYGSLYNNLRFLRFCLLRSMRWTKKHQNSIPLSLNLYDTPGLAPRVNVLFWGPGDFPVSYSNRATLWNAWNRHSGSFMVDTGILLSNME